MKVFSRTTDSSMIINDYLGFRERIPLLYLNPHSGAASADDLFFTFFHTGLWFQIFFVFIPNPAKT